MERYIVFRSRSSISQPASIATRSFELRDVRKHLACGVCRQYVYPDIAIVCAHVTEALFAGELLAQLAAAGHCLPTIVITGQGDIAMAVRAMRAGAVDLNEKPADPSTLLACVNRALRQAASPAERSSWRHAAAVRVAGLTNRGDGSGRGGLCEQGYLSAP